MAFVDCEKAFDSVEAIRKQEVEEVCCKILEDMYEDGTAAIKPHSETN